nr:hypothetical protein K-LCC10_0350 [Kaumoebavirus]
MQSVNHRIFRHIFQSVLNDEYNLDKYDRDQYYASLGEHRLKSPLLAWGCIHYTDRKGVMRYVDIFAPIATLSPVESIITIFTKEIRARTIHTMHYGVYSLHQDLVVEKAPR